MKKILLLLFIPLCLHASDYYSDEDKQLFNASLENFNDQVFLTKTSTLKLKVLYPNNYEIKTIAYDYDESEFVWKAEKLLEEKVKGDEKTSFIELSFEGMIEGKHHLNLPTIHLVSKEDEKKYVSLHPPLIEYEVINDIDPKKNKIYSKGPLSLDLRKSVEMDTYNTKNLLDQTREDLELAKVELQDKGYQKLLSYMLITFLLLSTGYFVYRILKKRSSLKEILGIQRDPRELAIEELSLLKKKELPQKGFFEDFYIELTQIVRSYIERQYEVKAPEQTTQEFLQEVIENSTFEKEIKIYLEEFLKFADLVKFAKLHPQVQDCGKAEVAAESFIQALAPCEP